MRERKRIYIPLLPTRPHYFAAPSRHPDLDPTRARPTEGSDILGCLWSSPSRPWTIHIDPTCANRHLVRIAPSAPHPMETQDIGDTVTVKHHSASASVTNASVPSPDLIHLNASSPHNSQNGAAHASPVAEQRASKIAACLSCRRSKVRCEKGPDPVRCRRCAQTGGDCIRPTFNVGRRKGVKKCVLPWVLEPICEYLLTDPCF